ncbi:hypothetical protein [Comamonas kerstersii]|nr:hypothetical protein [Comamonas kerstersii]
MNIQYWASHYFGRGKQLLSLFGLLLWYFECFWPSSQMQQALAAMNFLA